MASPRDPTDQITATPPTFDINKLFPPPMNTTAADGHHQFQPPYPSLPSSSYPQHTGASAFQNHARPLFHHQPADNSLPSNLVSDRSLSYPTPPVHAPNPSPNPNLNPNAGSQLMALLSGMLPSSEPEFSALPENGIPPGEPTRFPSSKIPKGRYLTGDSVVYDVDVRALGEAQPQLEVTPITKYTSDPQLVLGRQIAVNKSYICYGLKQGNIRVLNVHTASRSLLRGHSERITDMAFFAEDVGLLASVSKDGRVCVWKIVQSPEEDDEVQIRADIILSIQVQGGGFVHPQVCWHCRKQEILFVGVGRHILRIDTTKVRKDDALLGEEPFRCPLDKLVDGVQLNGEHDGEITDLSMCQWMTSRLVSASVDGTIKIWEDQKKLLLVLRPHGGLPVYTATFVTSLHRPDHILLITAGPLNREVKVWTSLSEASEEGWLLISDVKSWECTQTLDMTSSSQPHEEAFFNQVLVLPQAGLLLLANGKRNSIYAVHLEFGPNPAASKMNYLAEFTVTKPVLSFTAITETSPSGEHVIQIYCVQTQAIQQYALDLSLCTPSPLEGLGQLKLESCVSYDVTSFEGSGSTKQTDVSSADSAPNWSENSFISNAVTATVDVGGTQDASSVNTETRTTAVEQAFTDRDIVCVEQPSLQASPTFSRQLSGLRSPNTVSGEMPIVAIVNGNPRNGEKKNAEDERLELPNSTVNFKPPTHLVTPSEILRAAPSVGQIDAVKDKTGGNGNSQDAVNRKVDIAEAGVEGLANGSMYKDGFSTEEPTYPIAHNGKIFFSQALDAGVSIASERNAESSEKNVVNEGLEANVLEVTAPPPSAADVTVSSNYVSNKISEPPATELILQTSTPAAKGKKQKRKNSVEMASSSSNSADSSNEALLNSNSATEATLPQILAIRDKLNQVIAMSKELKNQMSATVNATLSIEGRRIEAALARNMEKIAKANSDALWARIQQENSKKEKLLQHHMQQVISLISKCMHKDVPDMLERTLKKELPAVQTSILRTITPTIEKIVSSAIAESFQKGVADKSVNQLDKSISAKLESVVAKQILTQFQTSTKQAIQDGVKSSIEAFVVPGFEAACKALFRQVEAAFQSGLTEHASVAIQNLNTVNSSLTVSLRDAISSASSVTNVLTGELAGGQRKLLLLALAGANSSAINPLVNQLSNGNLVEKFELLLPVDPRNQLALLISELKYEEAFTLALQRTDASVVSWLCSQVDLRCVLAMVPLPVSQGVLLSLLQQLACDIISDTAQKLSWMTDILSALNPADPLVVMHVRPIFDQVYQILNHQRTLPSLKGQDLTSIRLLMHVINSMLTTCK